MRVAEKKIGKRTEAISQMGMEFRMMRSNMA